MKKILPKVIFPLLLASIAVFLCFKNYTPGTYLIGWDSIHSEFNFTEAFNRTLNRVWSAEQGVGAIAAHSDMSDAPRILILWVSSLFLPLSFLRYFYMFICLIFGPLGIYFLLKYVFERERDSFWVYPASFLGAFFFLLNLGTLQNFYVPLEMFPTAFALTPWIIFTGFRFLREGKMKNAAFFSLSVILASPMAYAAAQAYVIYTGIFLFFITFAFFSSTKKLKLQRTIVLCVLVILLNLYWILPNIYSLLNQSGVIANAQTNRLFSSEAFLRNQEYGDLKNVLIQKNFLFDWRNFDFSSGQFKDLLSVWINHLENPFVILVGYALALFSILGLTIGIIRRERVALALIPSLLFALFFLFNINPPVGSLYNYFYTHFGVFREALRMPFTKFSILFGTIASFYFGYAAFVLLSSRGKYLATLKVIFIAVLASGLIYWMLPAFNGEFIGKNVRVSIPGEYENLFNWFREHSDGRTAFLPLHTKYAWEYRSWGYEGSGFVTYGIKNPLFYRDFDRWSTYNEDFYNQANNSLYGNNPEEFFKTLKKYQVKYLILDKSIVNVGGSSDLLYIPQIKDILSRSGDVREVAKFGFLTIYETNYDIGDNYILAPKSEIVDLKPSTSVGDLLISEDLSVNRGFSDAYNCDIKKIGAVYKKNSPGGILYKADNGGVSCDYIGYPELKYSDSYVLHIVGENRTGRSLKIYWTNFKTQKADLEELLPSGKFDKTFYIAPSKLDGGGYSLNFETRSFGRIASENLVTKVEVYRVFGTGDIQEEREIHNNLSIKNVKKYGTWGYKVDVQGDGLLQLSQGYEQGWIAMQLPVNNFQLDCIISCAILKHKILNNWSNAWEVDSSVCSQMKIGDCKLIIVYWPQILEWGGMLFGLALTWFILRRYN